VIIFVIYIVIAAILLACLSYKNEELKLAIRDRNEAWRQEQKAKDRRETADRKADSLIEAVKAEGYEVEYVGMDIEVKTANIMKYREVHPTLPLLALGGLELIVKSKPKYKLVKKTEPEPKQEKKGVKAKK